MRLLPDNRVKNKWSKLNDKSQQLSSLLSNQWSIRKSRKLWTQAEHHQCFYSKRLKLRIEKATQMLKRQKTKSPLISRHLTNEYFPSTRVRTPCRCKTRRLARFLQRSLWKAVLNTIRANISNQEILANQPTSSIIDQIRLRQIKQRK